jgi:hypothetical protein
MCAHDSKAQTTILMRLRVQLLIAEAAPKAEPVTTEGITRVGFIQLQAHMIMMQRLDLVWRMLFMFGYDRTLHLMPGLFVTIPEHSTNPVCPASPVPL